MAKRIVDEEMNFTVIINGKEAQKRLQELEKDTRKLTEENKTLTAQKRTLERQNKQDSAEYKILSATINANSREIKENKLKMAELQKQIGITGLTMAQLTSRAQAVRIALRNCIPGSEDYNRYQNELKQINARLAELNGKAKQTKLSLSGIADSFNKYAALGATVIATLTGIVFSIQKIIDFNGELSDSVSNVMKTTGMTKREVEDLAKSFGLLKTRTSRIDLLGIAEVGGRLGIAKEEIGDFVRVMDKAGVALGDSFEGGASVVAEKLGIIKGLYEDLRKQGVEKVFESVGSALNDLGADGAASEDNIAEFVKRIGAMPEAFKPAIHEALGLGAAFEESGLKAEIAATNYSKVISIAANNVSGFAAVMNKPRKVIEDMINNDPTDFFLRFANSLKKLSGTELAKTLDELKLNDNEVKMVLGAASKNTEMFKQKIDLAKQSMKEATSLTIEFNIKNNNLAATLEKIRKTVTGWFTSETFTKWLGASVEWLSKFIGATEDADGSVGRWRNNLIFLVKILSVAGTSIFSYKAGLQLVALWSNNVAKATALSNIVFKIQYGWLVAQEVASKALAFAQSFLTLKISEVRKAFVALSASMNLNPYAAVLALIAACAAAYVAFSDSASESNEVMKAQVQIANRVSEITGQQKQRVKDLVAVLKDENATNEQKKLALAELKKITDGYLETLTAENAQTSEGIRLIDRYIAAIDELAKAKAIVEVKTKLNTQKLEADNKILALSIEKKANTNEGTWGSRGKGDDGKIFGLGSRNKVEIQTEMDEEKENRKRIEYQIVAIESQKDREVARLRASIKRRTEELKKYKADTDKYREIMQDIKTDENALNTLLGITVPGNSPAVIDENATASTDGADEKAEEKARKKRESLAKKRLEELRKHDEDILKYKRDAEDAMFAAQEEGYEKERLLEQVAYERKLEDLRALLHSEAELRKMDKEINDAAAAGDMPKYNFLKSLKEKWVDENYHLNLRMQSEQQLHNIRIGIIEEKGANDALQKLDEKFRRERTVRETEFNNQLAEIKTVEEAKALLKDSLSKDELRKIKTLGDAKQALRDDFAKKELKRESEYLQKLLEELDKIINSKEFEGVDLDLLTPEMKERFKKQIEEAKKLKSELDLALSGKGKDKKRSPEEQQEREKAAQEHFASMNGGANILGYTAEEWGRAYEYLDTMWGKMEAGVMVVRALQNAWSQYNQYLEATENARMTEYERNTDRRKTVLKHQLDSGIISQESYNKSVERLDRQIERKKAELEYKQAKRKKTMSIVETAVNTSVAIMQGYAQLGPIGGSIAAVLMASLGALQIAAIQKQPLPARGYEKGLYPVKREQDGKMFNAQYGGPTKSGIVRKPTFFLTGENGPEMILESKVLQNMNPAVRESLNREIARIKGYEFGKYPSQTPIPEFNNPTDTSPKPSDAGMFELAVSVMSETNSLLRDLKENGVIGKFYGNDYGSMDRLRKSLEEIQQRRDNNKH